MGRYGDYSLLVEIDKLNDVGCVLQCCALRVVCCELDVD